MTKEAVEEKIDLKEDPAEEKVEVVKPTREELAKKGWSEKELDLAEKRDMFSPSGTAKQEAETTETKPEDEVKPEEKKKNTSFPDFTFKTPEQEKAFLEAFGAGTPQRAMYFSMKDDRRKRQLAEEERDKIALRAQVAEDRLKEIETTSSSEEDGDPDDKPLTMRQIKEMARMEQENAKRQNEKDRAESIRVSESLKNQEDYAKSVYTDFEETVKLATDLISNLETLVPERWKQEKIIKHFNDLKIIAAQSPSREIDGYNASIMAYELGQMHPDYGVEVNGNKADRNGHSRSEAKASGGLTPEQMKRIEANTQRRVSSASIPGGNGKRTVSVDDVTIKDFLNMSPEDRNNFRKKHPEKMRQLLRG